MVYRPFLKAFSDLLSSTIKLPRLLIVGDFNINVDDNSDLFARSFTGIMDSFHFTQFVSSPTHTKGHKLDLVFTLGLNIDSICSGDIFTSDHHCIIFNLSFSCLPCGQHSHLKFLYC